MVQIRENFKFGNNFSKHFDFIRSKSISVQISKNLDFGHLKKNLYWNLNF